MLEVSTKVFKKGPCSKIYFSIISGGSRSNVLFECKNNLALIIFRFKNTDEEGGSHVMQVSITKYESERDSRTRLKVTCGTTTIQSQCHWALLGRNRVELQHGAFRSVFEVYVTVYETKIIGFENLYEDTDLTDFKLTTPDGSMAVHKACLAAHSDYFKRMFIGQWKETLEGTLEISGLNVKYLQLLKKYMYLGTLPEDRTELRLLLIVASQYLIDNLKTECIMKLVESMLPEDFYSLHNLACGYNIPELTIAMANMTSDDVVSKANELKIKDDIKSESEVKDSS